MTFQQLIQDDLFKLPLTQPDDKPFDQFIEEFLSVFLEKINSLDDDRIHLTNGRGVDPEFIVSAQEAITSGLVDSIKAYYEGTPFKAYQMLEDTLRNRIKDLYEIIKQRTYPSGDNFYRLRIQEGNYGLKPNELFHIPFELRGKVQTQRFSIPGFPSLYLGRTLYVCWEELKRPEIDTFHSIRFQNIRELRLLDLTPPDIDLNSEISAEMYRYVMTFPLIACCSVRVRDYSDSFKPEYIIPQLLLQWVRENDILDGIRYNSTHISQDLFRQKGELSNIVLPVKENNHQGQCNKLKAMFESTSVVSWQQYNFALGGAHFRFNREELRVIDEKLPRLELIKGRKYPYSYSILGKLELYLDGMKTSRLT